MTYIQRAKNRLQGLADQLLHGGPALKKMKKEILEEVEALAGLEMAAREFLSDWKKGDFKLPKLAQYDAEVLKKKLEVGPKKKSPPPHLN